MQRISVDLPDPDGPQMTMRSPRATVEVDVPQHVEVVAIPLVHLLEADDRIAHGASGSSKTRSAASLASTRLSTHRL